jgi:DNA-binding transcriptional MerR regulator
MLTVSQIAAAVGLGPETIRHYSDVGLLQPVINSETNYRYYDSEDALRASDIRIMRSLGLPIKKIEALQGKPIGVQIAALDAQRREMQAEITRLQQNISRLDEVRGFLEKCALCTGTVEDVSRPPIYSLYSYGQDKDYSEARKLLPRWAKAFPFTHISISVPKAELNDPGFSGCYSTELGLGVTESYFAKLGLSAQPPVKTVPAGRCLIIYFKTNDPLSLTPSDLRPLLDKASALGVRFLNDSSGRLLAIEEAAGEPLYYMLIRCRVGTAS